jgi:hypothetical protein
VPLLSDKPSMSRFLRMNSGETVLGNLVKVQANRKASSKCPIRFSLSSRLPTLRVIVGLLSVRCPPKLSVDNLDDKLKRIGHLLDAFLLA